MKQNYSNLGWLLRLNSALSMAILCNWEPEKSYKCLMVEVTVAKKQLNSNNPILRFTIFSPLHDLNFLYKLTQIKS